MSQVVKFRDFEGNYTIFDDNGRLLVVESRPARPGQPHFPWTKGLSRLLVRIFREDNTLFHAGDAPVFICKGKPVVCTNPELAWDALHDMVDFGIYNQKDVSLGDTLSVPNEALKAKPDARLKLIMQRNNIIPVELAISYSKYIKTLTRSDVPEYGGLLGHPIVGNPPQGWFSQAINPNPTTNFDLLRDLFEPLPLDDGSRARLYSYLLAAFHAKSLTCPVPMLVLDSWTRAKGKTETLGAIAELLDGVRSTLSPPSNSGDVSELIAHYNTGIRMACLDNLSTSRPWDVSWISMMLTDRSPGGRVKYSAKTQSFKGKLLGVTMNFGEATLSEDFLSRAWRVQILGRSAGRYRHRPNEFAVDNKEALQQEIYSCVSSAPAWERGVITNTRCHEFEQIGAAAYAHLFGIEQQQVAKDLQDADLQTRALGKHCLALYEACPVASQYLPRSVGSAKRPPARLVRDLVGSRSLGFEVTQNDNGRVELTEISNEPIAN